jgi:flagellar biosynthesis chaperone FliJ
MNKEFVEVDELILKIADYKNDYSDMAAETLFRKCSTSWGAYQYLRDRLHNAWLPDRARQQVRQIIKRIQVQIHQCREYGYAYERRELKAGATVRVSFI